MFIPLEGQLKEQAQRKVEERAEKKFNEANKDQAFFKPKGDSDGLYDIDEQRKKNERR